MLVWLIRWDYLLFFAYYDGVGEESMWQPNKYRGLRVLLNIMLIIGHL